MSGADLSKVYCSQAILIEAHLEEAILDGTDLSRADLSGANLSNVRLSETNLSSVNLCEAELSTARFHDVDLSNADLRCVCLSGVDLSRVVLSGADLSGAFLAEANLSNANLSGAYLGNAHLSNADLRGTNFSCANLSRAFLLDAKLDREILSGAILIGTEPYIRVSSSQNTFDDAVFREEQFAIYTEDDNLENAQELFEVTVKLAAKLGLGLDAISDWQNGSLWRKVIVQFRGCFSQNSVEGRAKVAENIFLGKQDLNATIELDEAAVQFEKVFKGKKGAVAINLGLFIFLRMPTEDGDGDTFFKRLTVEERVLLNDNPSLLKDPVRLFGKVEGLNSVQLPEAFAQSEERLDADSPRQTGSELRGTLTEASQAS